MTVTLVTGATGFVGSHIAAACEEAGREVRCTVRVTSDLRWIEALSARRVEADLRDPGALAAALEGVETVVHVAGITWAPDEGTYHAVNAEGTRSLVRAAATAGVRRMVFVSSLAARGPDRRGARPGSGERSTLRPADSGEASRVPADGGAGGPDAPVSAYGRSKLAAERALRERAGELEITVLRPGGVYGPRDTDLLPFFRLASRGRLFLPAAENLLQPVYAGDVARAAVRAVESDAGFGPFPVLERERHDWSAVTGAMAGAAGRELRVHRVPARLFLLAGAVLEMGARFLGRSPLLDRRRAVDLARYSWTGDPAPTEAALGWRPRVALPEGIRRTMAWYREAGWL